MTTFKARNRGHARSLARRFKHLRTAAEAAGLTTYEVPYECTHSHPPVRITATGNCARCANGVSNLTEMLDRGEYISIAMAMYNGMGRAPIALEDMIACRGVCRPNDRMIEEFAKQRNIDVTNVNAILAAGFMREQLPHNSMWRIRHGGSTITCSSCESKQNAANRVSKKRIAATGAEEWEG